MSELRFDGEVAVQTQASTSVVPPYPPPANTP